MLVWLRRQQSYLGIEFWMNINSRREGWYATLSNKQKDRKDRENWLVLNELPTISKFK